MVSSVIVWDSLLCLAPRALWLFQAACTLIFTFTIFTVEISYFEED